MAPKINTSAVTTRGAVQGDGRMQDIAGSGGSDKTRAGRIAREGSMPTGGEKIAPGKDLTQHPEGEFYGGGKGIPARPGRSRV